MSNYENVKRYRHKRREDAKSYLGGRCVVCGTDNELEFDHVDPNLKQFDISNGIARNTSWTKLKTELDKCQLLCSDHHKIKTRLNGDIASVGHGEGLSGKRNCPCAPCKQRKKEYMAEYHRRQK